MTDSKVFAVDTVKEVFGWVKDFTPEMITSFSTEWDNWQGDVCRTNVQFEINDTIVSIHITPKAPAAQTADKIAPVGTPFQASH